MTDLRSKSIGLFKSGYRVVSNSYRHLSRIDREDWRDVLADHHMPRTDKRYEMQGREWVAMLDKNNGASGDYYRSVLSKDNLDLPKDQFDDFKRLCREMGSTHGWGNCNEFLPICEAA